jgi:alkanesulfonate monooxygenase SsuD/methylene tetrahydromethanopterin reductase-like flavin-dependent oxidoreductase (luciferase family)
MKVMRERMQAMQASWTSDEAGYHGEHVAFDRIWCWPAEIAG